MATAMNVTDPNDGQWNSKPAWKLPGWVEPVLVAAILFGAMWLTRRRKYSVLRFREAKARSYLDSDAARSTDDLLDYDARNNDDAQPLSAALNNQPKQRRVLGFTIQTPNTYRFRKNVHSRVLQKFPFLIEMFYWIINYAFYRMTAVLSKALFRESGVWEVAQRHAVAVLEIEQESWLSMLFPVHEVDVQQWFMHGHQDFLTVLNRVYALIHIPGTVGFIAWYYYIAPSHPTFATVRRTMTLTNFLAFITFILYPCAPPRFLPSDYGFLDTVRHDDAQSIWMKGDYVNALAAMPSMHFGYAFCIGCTMIYHSGIFRRELQKGEQTHKSLFWQAFYLVVGLGYPALILTTIVATANHYWLDALVATTYVLTSFALNKVFYVFLPLEDCLLWAIRAEKPIPSTGERFREQGLRL